jgi:pimeloyl-ACP methyl ester carboxylesterase
MATFVLVHGAFAGGWCWERLVPLLEAEGHTVDALDLPGHGADPAPIAEMTLENNARRVADHVAAAAAERVVLVGHSMGGMSITQAAELVPERIAKLVYLAAFLPGDGMTLPQLAAMEPNVDGVQANLVVDEAEGTFVVADHAVREVVFGECDDEAFAFAGPRREPEALAAAGAAVQLTEARAGSVPRIYIECTLDRAIGIEKQRVMQALRPCERVFTLETDHSPFLSTPRELADCLLAIAS